MIFNNEFYLFSELYCTTIDLFYYFIDWNTEGVKELENQKVNKSRLILVLLLTT